MDDKVEAVDHDPNNNNYETRQIYSYPGKTKSRVWEYFGFYKIKEGPPSKIFRLLIDYVFSIISDNRL